MLNKRIRQPLALVLLLYLVFFFFRFIEYFYIRTDATIIGEAVIHKLIGIAILFISAKYFFGSPFDIGFKDKELWKKLLFGLCFGIAVFTVAYLSELAILKAQGKAVSAAFYVSTYAVDENIGCQTGLMFYLICIAGNLVNVLMEEGVFRGLFQRILEEKYRFITAAVIASALFGLWHVISPVRSYVDGNSSMGGMLANILMLVFTSALVGFKFALLTKMTGSVYMSMGDHFVNNTIVNILHVISNGGVDELMFVRITIAQTLSFFIVLAFYLKLRKKESRS